MGILSVTAVFLRALFPPHAAIAAQNLALRQHLGVIQCSVKRPQLRQRDRVFWVWLSRLWSDWRSSLPIVNPEVDNGCGLWRNCGVTAFNMCNMVNMLSGAKPR